MSKGGSDVQIRYLDGEVIEINELPDGEYEIRRNDVMWIICEAEHVDVITYHLKQAKPWIRDNGDGTFTIEYPDEQVARESAFHNAQNQRAGGFSGD